jgi:hypothetical protein
MNENEQAIARGRLSSSTEFIDACIIGVKRFIKAERYKEASNRINDG